MARHPDWFDRLEAISTTVADAPEIQWFGRNEIRAIFACSERDSIRLLHKFGATIHQNALYVPRDALAAQLDVIRKSATYAAFQRQRHNLAGQLSAARAETQARHFSIAAENSSPETKPGFRDLPATITWRRTQPLGSARFEIVYRNGSDLMTQLAAFLAAAGVNREEFFAGTEPENDADA